MRSYFNVFSEGEFSQYSHGVLNNVKDDIDGQKEDYLLNVNENEYAEHITSKYFLDMPVLDFESIYADEHEEEGTVSDYGRTIRKKGSLITYYIPITQGDEELLKLSPSSRVMWSTKTSIRDNALCFWLSSLDFQGVEQIKSEADRTMKYIGQLHESLKSDVDAFNVQLRHHVICCIQQRKDAILKRRNLVSSLGVPIKKRQDVLETFVVPIAKSRKKVMQRPEVNENGFVPEPTMDKVVYQEILQVIHDTGKVFERLPSTYEGKEEEDLRDHFILMLEPRFEGSTTGETFNRSGKTDILVRYENSNVFIAECKYWTGGKGFLATIDQLLKYLTWRDSKAAVIMFVDNKAFTPVMQTVEQVVTTHPNYLGFIDKRDESWLNYRFHINDDENREVKLAVLLFHFPK